MTDDTTDSYLEKEIGVIMMGFQLDQKFREALLAWAKMLIHRVRRDTLQRKEVLDLVEAIMLGMKALAHQGDPIEAATKMGEALTLYREAVKK